MFMQNQNFNLFLLGQMVILGVASLFHYKC